MAALSGPTREDARSSFNVISWQRYENHTLTTGEIAELRRGDEQLIDYILGDMAQARAWTKALLKVAATITDDAARQYALTRLEDVLLAEAPPLSTRAKLFLPEGGGPLDCGPFLRAMASADPYSQRAASGALALLLTVCEGEMESFVVWLTEQLASASSRSSGVRAAVPALCILLRRTDARVLFGQHGGVGYLAKLLRSQGGGSAGAGAGSAGAGAGGAGGGAGGGGGANAQLLYELTFCLWTLSFCEEVRPAFLATGAIHALCDQVSAAPREKVVRVALAALRNLCADADAGPEGGAGGGDGAAETAQYNAEMIARGLPKTLKNLSGRKFADEEVSTDVTALHKTLMENHKELSTYETFVAEVSAGRLKWGPTHSEKFWRLNARKAEAGDFRVVKMLIALLHAKEPVVVAIAAYDIGEFVRFYPQGKAVAKHLGARDLVMDLIQHPDPDVQRHALQCISKMMITSWEFLASSSSSKEAS